MNLDPNHITATLLRQECGHGAYERGRGYFNQGRATLVTAEPLEDAIRLTSACRGSNRRRYEQIIDISDTGFGPIIEGECDCPVGFNCKHVVAACLTWKAQSDPPQGYPSAGGPFGQWLARFAGAEAAPTDEPAEALLYLLGRPPRGDGVEVSFAIARRRRDGSWGKGRKITFSALAHPYGTPRYRQPPDEEIAHLLHATTYQHWGNARLTGAAGNLALALMVDTGRAFWGDTREDPLRQGREREAELTWEAETGGFRLRVAPAGGGIAVPVVPPLYIDPEDLEVGRLVLPPGLDGRKLALIDQAPTVARRDARSISRMLALGHPELPTPEPVPTHDLCDPPVPVLRLHLDGQRPLDSHLILNFRYGDTEIGPDDLSSAVTREKGGEIVRHRRDAAVEAAAGERLIAEGAQPVPGRPSRFVLHREGQNHQAALSGWFGFLEDAVPQLQAEGWQIEQGAGSGLRLSRADAIEAEVEGAENDWFGLRFDLEVEGRRMPLLPLVSQLLGSYRPGELPATLYLEAGGGHYVAVPGDRIEPILQTVVDLFDNVEDGGESLRLSRLDAPRLLELGDTPVKGGNTLATLARRLRAFDGLREAKVPTTFKGRLRGYQQQGVNWLQFLRQYDLAGLLADDMGLGKTVQTLAHLAIEKRAGRMTRPSLVVAPTSLMGNWRREAMQFVPTLKVLVLHGPERHAHLETLAKHDLILTTYPLLPRDREALLAQSYHYLILDEAQQIKNPRAQAAQLVRAIDANHRLCLTGTPMENHLGELWAQFDFLLPGFLGTREAFTRNYRTPIEKQGDTERLRRLTRRTAPFMLRRTKDLVASELPEKSELLRTVPIEGRQAALYEGIRLTMEKKVREAIAQKGLARSHITILDALLKLRQVCCDPRLLPKGTRGVQGAHSAKLALLMELLPELLEEGRRILLFSQFTTMLGLIEEELTKIGIRYTKLTGQTRRRDEAIDAFRNGEVDLFLISLKAGGVGLNLTEADTVIHYDPWWNPAVEAQATDRTHRIGQDKPVFVYKLITEGTVEERIIALQERKRRLAGNVYGNGRGVDEPPIDADTIKALLGSE